MDNFLLRCNENALDESADKLGIYKGNLVNNLSTLKYAVKQIQTYWVMKDEAGIIINDQTSSLSLLNESISYLEGIISSLEKYASTLYTLAQETRNAKANAYQYQSVMPGQMNLGKFEVR